MNSYTSPFQFGTLATDRNFIDRVEDRALLKQLMKSHINTMLVSPRRWGKYSLVKKAMDELREEMPDVRVCYIDAFSISTETEFYRVFASQVIACTATKVERWISDAKKFLNGVVPQVVINDQVTDFMAFDLRYVPQEQDKLAILQLPEMIAKDKGIKIIVCIDEFQQLAGLAEYKDMEGKMRSVWQRQEDVTYCLYGSKRHMMHSTMPTILSTGSDRLSSSIRLKRKTGFLLLFRLSRKRRSLSLRNLPKGYAT